MEKEHIEATIHRFPTREDFRAALETLQEQLNRRFIEVKTLQDVELKQRDILFENELHERDKAVEVLARTLEQQVKSGDENLKQHITNQIDQIKLALDSSELLEVERVRGIGERISGVQEQVKSVHREIDIEAAATKTAISKAEIANEKRFESVNEFRAQMADQSALFISRREVEAMVGSLAEKNAAITDRINRNEGRGVGISQLAGWIFGGIGILVGLISIFVWLTSIQPKIDRNSEFRQQAAPALKVP